MSDAGSTQERKGNPILFVLGSETKAVNGEH